MGAVRNSNTRASHASVETPANQGEHKTSGAGLTGSVSGTGTGTGALDSPHLGPEATDRRPSFSYLRRASDRRRRRRMFERGSIGGADMEEPGSTRFQWREHEDGFHPGRASRRTVATEASAQHNRGSESGLEQAATESDGNFRRDSNTGQRSLRRSNQIYDEEGEQVFEERAKQEPEVEEPPSESQRVGPSMNDRLTEAVSDVMEFVREESLRRGKRHSMIRRRHQGAAPSSYLAGGHTDEAELDSGDRLSNQTSSSANYRRRRLLRRSPRRGAGAQHLQRAYNDSDSGASLSQDAALGASQRYRLQQHGGSAQDTHLLYGGSRGTAILVEQHRRHQSADAARQAYFRETGEEVDEQGQLESGQPMIRPIPVGASPPPLPANSEHEMLALARRKREVEEQLAMAAAEEVGSAIHAVDEPETSTAKPIRFMAPKVTSPLSSPSAMLMPDEEVVPPSVPSRGRRLPQIPALGGGLIKSAADFLHSSIYGARPECSIAAVTGAAATPLLVAGAKGSLMEGGVGESESVFPVVSESPTVIAERSLRQRSLADSPLPAESIHFPRVSFSPTRTPAKYATHPASLIATQAGGSTQSSVLPTGSQPQASAMAMSQAGPEGASALAAWARARHPKRDEDDDWF